jgi:hypothetical protein
MAVPVGLALIGLGLSLWRNPGSPAVEIVAEPTHFEHATV